MKLFFYFILTVFSLNLATAQDALTEFVTNNSLRTANISVYIKDMKTGKIVADHRADKAAIPASTLKVITTATALEVLGAEFRFETILCHDGKLEPDGTLNGNLYIVGSGDPTLGSSKMGDNDFLKTWTRAILSAGIKKINGNILGDDTRFDNEGSNSKWSWDDIGNYYAPGIWGIAYLDNTVAVTFQSGAVGTTPTIIRQQPQLPEMIIDNFVLCTKTTSDNAYFFGAPKNMNLTVRGEIPANRPAFVVKAGLPNPSLLLARDFQAALIAGGVVVNGQANDMELYQRGRLLAPVARTSLYTHYSVPLREIVREANQKSNNFYTEQIFKSLSLSKHLVATNQHSIEIIRQYWRSKGLDINELFMEDGSGLSPANAVTARFLTELMQYMYQKSIHKDAFFNSLAVAGKTGTLAGIMKKSHLEGNLYGKSGTISRVRAYTGYITNNREWVFTVIVNNSAVNSWQTLSIIEDFIKNISR